MTRRNKILLIAPRFCKGKFRVAIHPVTGLGYIAESLQKAGFEVKVFDMNLQYSYKDLQNIMNTFGPDMIGFTVMTFGHREVYEVMNKLKQAYPKAKIVAGGPHISTIRTKVLEDCPGIDYGVVLEGDRTIVELCEGKDPKEIQGLIYRKGGRSVMNEFTDFIIDLDKIDFPKYEAFELEKYPAKQIGIATSRGCPYDCIYCPVISAIGKRFRARSAQSVVEEIEYWYGRGYRDILILDDNFTLSKKRVEEICDMLKEKNFTGLKLKCPNGIRADRVDYDTLRAMREVGFDMIAFGVESARDEVLKTIKKGEKIATIEQRIKEACDLGFDVDLFFIIGSPGERYEDVEASFSLATRYPVRCAKFYNIIPFPTTELFEWIQEKGYLLHSMDHILNNASHYVNEPCFFTPEMSADDRKKAFKKGQKITKYLRRRYIERNLKGLMIFKKLFSLLYTFPLVDEIMNNNSTVIRIKERIKLFVSSRQSV